MSLNQLLSKNMAALSRTNLPVNKYYFFGNDEETDINPFMKRKLGFSQKIEKISYDTDSKTPYKIIVGITRFNFFRLDKISGFIDTLEGRPSSFVQSFEISPTNTLHKRFKTYLYRLVRTTRKYELMDVNLLKLLQTFESLSIKKFETENVLIRLLGIICKNAFIGPAEIVLDISHSCNQKCNFCGFFAEGTNLPNEFYSKKISFSKLKPLIDDLAKLKVESIHFIGAGEPLLNHDFIEIVEYISKKNMNTRFFTNGIALNEENISKLLNSKIEEIWCSISAATPEIYQMITGRDKEVFPRILANINKITTIKESRKEKLPRIVSTHVITSQNYNQIVLLALQDVKLKVNASRFYLMRLDSHNKDLMLKKNQLEYIENKFENVEKILKSNNITVIKNLNKFNPKHGNYCGDMFLKNGCYIGYIFSEIDIEGNVQPCCQKVKLGNFLFSPFISIWNSNEYKNFREAGLNLSDNDLNLNILKCTFCESQSILIPFQNKLAKYNLTSYLEDTLC